MEFLCFEAKKKAIYFDMEWKASEKGNHTFYKLISIAIIFINFVGFQVD